VDDDRVGRFSRLGQTMPPEVACPFCLLVVPDWHFEWHIRGDQAEIVAGKKAMQCPFCNAGVAFDGFTVSRPVSNCDLAHRAIQQAARWARNQNQSLRVYLKTREGQPFAGFWLDAEVDSADQQAAAKP
jgi:hypothetical protein